MAQTLHYRRKGSKSLSEMQPRFLKVGVAYLLWCLSLFGFCGIQRFYVGQPLMGLLYLVTFGFCGIGQLLDLLLIPRMVNYRNTYLRGRYSLPEEPTSPMLRLLQAAKEHGGVLSAAQAALYTHFDAQTIEELLFEAQRVGYATVFNDPETGAVRYRFDV